MKSDMPEVWESDDPYFDRVFVSFNRLTMAFSRHEALEFAHQLISSSAKVRDKQPAGLSPLLDAYQEYLSANPDIAWEQITETPKWREIVDHALADEAHAGRLIAGHLTDWCNEFIRDDVEENQRQAAYEAEIDAQIDRRKETGT